MSDAIAMPGDMLIGISAIRAYVTVSVDTTEQLATRIVMNRHSGLSSFEGSLYDDRSTVTWRPKD